MRTGAFLYCVSLYVEIQNQGKRSSPVIASICLHASGLTIICLVSQKWGHPLRKNSQQSIRAIHPALIGPIPHSVQFSCSVVSDSLQPHGLQHARLLCLSPTPRAYSNSCPSHQWGHPTISASVIPFSSHLQSFPASGSFQISRFFASGSQSIGVSATTSVLPMNIQYWFPLGWLVRSPCSPRDSQESSPTPQFKTINSSALSFLHSPTLTSIHDHWQNQSFD